MSPISPPPWQYTTFPEALDHWQTLIAGVLAFAAGFGTVVAAIWAIWVTRSTAKKQIDASREEADKVIAATREQTETAVRLERERVSSEALAFSAMLDAAMVRVLNEVGWARKTYPQTLSQQEGASVEALFVRHICFHSELRNHGSIISLKPADRPNETESLSAAFPWKHIASLMTNVMPKC